LIRTVVTTLRKGLSTIGALSDDGPLAIRGSFGYRTPSSLRAAIDGMSDPLVADWTEVGISFWSENTDDAHEAQGVTTDGEHWFLISNGSKRIVAYDDDAVQIFTVGPTATVWDAMWNDAGRPDRSDDSWNPHLGAGCFFEGSIYVPIQNPMGLWRVNLQTAEQTWRPAHDPPRDNMFPWFAVHPVTRRLYTCNADLPVELNAYDRETFVYVPTDNITLGPAPITLDAVQGAVFTAHGRVVLVCGNGLEAVFCYSALNGHFFGATPLEDYSETESVVVRQWTLNGTVTHIHILELANDVEDDCYLHSWSVPEPARL
jgi:hypothetical protein